MHVVGKQNYVKRWFLGYLPSLVCLALIIISLISVSTDYVAHSSRLNLERWSCYGALESSENWDATLDGLLLASELNPLDADIYFDLGRLYEWKALSGKAWNKMVKDARNMSILNFQMAVKFRPTWALAWANLAQAKLLNRKVDEELFIALENSLEYGRWQVPIQKKYLWLSIGIWSKIPNPLQIKILKHIEMVLNRDIQQDQHSMLRIITSISVRFNWFDQLDTVVHDEKDIQYILSVKNSAKKRKNILSGSDKAEEYVCRVGV